MLRISMDAKARVHVGSFSRRGTSRVRVSATDHDFNPDEIVTPFGLFLPEQDDLFLYMSTSKVTSDFIVDVLQDWWDTNRDRHLAVHTLLLDLDNGPENNSHRTQFMMRMVAFARENGLNIRLTYYPPYHSKYNPIERCWAALEHYWNGSLLDSIEAVVGFAENMTWQGKNPVVRLVETVYQTGVKLTKKAMELIEARIKRLPGLDKWFVQITATP